MAQASDGAGEGELVAKLYWLRGRVEAALGQYEAAAATLHLARDTAEWQETRPLVWRCEVALGDLALRRVDQTAAATHFAAARGLIETLAATLANAQQRPHFLVYALGHLPAPREATLLHAAKLLFDGLTARERTVAALIMQGKSDRQIAEELVLSKRTVGTHVTNILNKLGFSSRTQIAAWAVEKGLSVQDPHHARSSQILSLQI
jgi:DNA-binding CsgD family transcriptional regulator